jgi:type IV pilus assembly protein PilY1
MNKILNGMMLTCAFLVLGPLGARAQTSYTENFTGANTINNWYYFKGACLTAGTTSATVNNIPGSSTAVPGLIPSCASMATGSYYYNTGNRAGQALVGGTSGTIPGTDPTKGGALRFTNVPAGQQSGAILSNFSFPVSTQGLQVTFTTETYEGDGGGGDGADGISFFLQDATQNPDLGATGGSLAYGCTNETGNYDSQVRVNGLPRGYDGLTGAYIGIGIDEYGNFMNPGDNTSTGANTLNGGTAFQGNRVGLRGSGNTSWTWLSTNYSSYYSPGLTSTYSSAYSNSAASEAVRQTCINGYVMQYNSSAGTFSKTSTKLNNYAALGYSNLSGVQIANESAIYRGNGSSGQLTSQYGVPITYNLKITPQGLLTLSYSYNGGASIPVVTGQNITTSNGNLPTNVRFGFAGSDGGSTNIHEVMCFQASPQTSASSSASGNQKQSQPVVQGSQVYFAYYDPTNWSGSVTSESLLLDVNNNAYLSPTANWDASCVLTGVGPAPASCASTGVVGPITAASPTNPASSGATARVMLTWNGSTGIPFEWGTTPDPALLPLDSGDSTVKNYRLKYLRGDRTNEQNSSGTGALTATGYRDRASVLGDVIDSSPTWVGPPSTGYPNVWADQYNGGTMPENSGQTYAAFVTQEQTRINVVYAGSNDGFLHGFRSGYYNTSGAYVGTGTGTSFVGTENDGQEMLAYMPGLVLNNIQTASLVGGVMTPNSASNYSDPQYGHHFDVDATPGTGDVFYGGAWHTLLVGGLGAGGAGVFALNITYPAVPAIAVSPANATDPTFSEGNASSIVIGDWSTTTNASGTTTSTLACVGVTSNASTTSPASCGLNLGSTFGTPQIRRFHNGQWGAVFGNGFGSSTGDGGIYVMLLNTTTGAPTFYYLSTGTSTKSNGIAYVSTADLDGDHITDYVYAGDLLGNIWRFDLTNASPALWGVTSIPVYTTASGQPITSKLSISSIVAAPNRRVLVEFGTGRQFPLTNTSAMTYSTTPQSLYGIWDWNLAGWNARSSIQYSALPFNGTAAPTTGLTAGSLTPTNLQAQSAQIVTVAGVDYRTVTNNTICWAGTTGCSGTPQYGWYLPLTFGYANGTDPNQLSTGTNSANPTVYEQVIYNPVLVGDTFVVNTAIPGAISATMCFAATAGGYTLAINPATGGSYTKPVFPPAIGTQTITTISSGASSTISTSTGSASSLTISGIGASGTGTPFAVTTGGVGAQNGNLGGGSNNPPCTPGSKTFFVTQTVGGTPTTLTPNLQCNIASARETWIQRR